MRDSVYRRRRAVAMLALLLAIVVVAYATAANGSKTVDGDRYAALRFMSDGKPLAEVQLASFALKTASDRARLRRVILNDLPSSDSFRTGKARITVSYDRRSAVARAMALGESGGTVYVRKRPVASVISAPVFKQKLRNNCEAAALEILLASEGVRSSQLTLQRQLKRDGPLDPVGTGPARIWGDPDVGFVGRPDGGGTAGGFGVYPGPIRALARKYGTNLEDLTGRSASAIYDKLLAGHAVMAWLGLANGPFNSWQTAAGKQINVNMNEHTVVLTGIDRNGTLTVVDPLTGVKEQQSPTEFERMWDLLGNRAVSK